MLIPFGDFDILLFLHCLVFASHFFINAIIIKRELRIVTALVHDKRFISSYS